MLPRLHAQSAEPLFLRYQHNVFFYWWIVAELVVRAITRIAENNHIARRTGASETDLADACLDAFARFPAFCRTARRGQGWHKLCWFINAAARFGLCGHGDVRRGYVGLGLVVTISVVPSTYWYSVLRTSESPSSAFLFPLRPSPLPFPFDFPFPLFADRDPSESC